MVALSQGPSFDCNRSEFSDALHLHILLVLLYFVVPQIFTTVKQVIFLKKRALKIASREPFAEFYRCCTLGCTQPHLIHILLVHTSSQSNSDSRNESRRMLWPSFFLIFHIRLQVTCTFYFTRWCQTSLWRILASYSLTCTNAWYLWNNNDVK